MKCFICVDNNYGLTFNNRRISRDKEVLLDMISDNKKICMSDYSKKLFKSYGLEKFIGNDNCSKYFLENNIPNETIKKCNILVIYNWNRNYPSDQKLNINFSLFEVVNITEFTGSSHDIITKITYEKICNEKN